MKSHYPLILGILSLVAAGIIWTGSRVAAPSASEESGDVVLADAAAELALPGNLDQPIFIEDDAEYVFNEVLPKDGIPTIYEPEFVPAAESSYQPEALVMGVEIDGDARAYSIGILKRFEIVNDVVGEIPVLVSW